MEISNFLEDHAGLFEDSPRFASDVLLPAFEAGFNVGFISPFIPSYVFEFFKGLEELHRPPNRVTLTLIVQRMVTDTSFDEVVSAAIDRFIFDGADKTKAKRLLGELSKKGILELRLVLSAPGKGLSTTCKGLITPTNTLDRRFIAFHDEVPGDYNSPINLWASWIDNQAAYARSVKDLQFVAQLLTTKESVAQTKEYLLGLAPVAPKKIGRPKRVTPKNVEEDEFDDEDFELEEDFDFESSSATRWLSDSYTHAPDPFGYSESEIEDYFSRSFAEPVDGEDYDEYTWEDVFTEAVSNAHIGATEDFGELASCWCGREFPAEFGCPLAGDK